MVKAHKSKFREEFPLGKRTARLARFISVFATVRVHCINNCTVVCRAEKGSGSTHEGKVPR